MANSAKIVTGGLLIGVGAVVLKGPPSTSRIEKVLPPSATATELREWLNTIRVGDGLEVSTWAQVCGTISVMTDECENEFLTFLVRLIGQNVVNTSLTKEKAQEIVSAAKAEVPFHLVNSGDGSFVFENETQDGYDLCHRRLVALFQRTWESFSSTAFTVNTLQGIFISDIYNETIAFYRKFKYGQGFVKAMCSVLSIQPDDKVLADKIALKWFGKEIEFPLRGMVAAEDMELPLVPPHQTILMGFEGILPEPIVFNLDFSDPEGYTQLITEIPGWRTLNLKEKNGLMARISNEIEAALYAVRVKIDYATFAEFWEQFKKELMEILHRATKEVVKDLVGAIGLNPDIVEKGSSLIGAGLILGGGYLVSTGFTEK